ncbi:hypothetical protein [Kineococcus auxinigenes]
MPLAVTDRVKDAAEHLAAGGAVRRAALAGALVGAVVAGVVALRALRRR